MLLPQCSGLVNLSIKELLSFLLHTSFQFLAVGTGQTTCWIYVERRDVHPCPLPSWQLSADLLTKNVPCLPHSAHYPGFQSFSRLLTTPYLFRVSVILSFISAWFISTSFICRLNVSWNQSVVALQQRRGGIIHPLGPGARCRPFPQ